jgi:hypothetical protein
MVTLAQRGSSHPRQRAAARLCRPIRWREGVVHAQAGLEVADDRAKETRCEQAWSQRPGSILANWRKLAQSSPGRRRHAAQLPADLLAHSLWAIRSGESRGLGGVRRGAQGMRTHVGDGSGLSGSSGSSGRRRGPHGPGGAAAGEPPFDLVCDVKLAAAEGPGSRDRVAWTSIAWSLRLK